MEVATVGQSYAVGRPQATGQGNGGVVVAGQGNGGVVVAGQQTRTFAAPIGDGQVAVGRVTETVAVAVDDEGNQQVSVMRRVGLTTVQAVRTSFWWPQEPAADVEPFKPCTRWSGFCLMVLVAASYTAMWIIGSIRFNACPDTTLAIYSVVQGLFVTLNGVSLAVMFARAKHLKAHKLIGILIYAFNIIFGTVHLWHMNTCDDPLLHTSAVGFTIPIVGPFFLVLFCCCCSCCRSD